MLVLILLLSLNLAYAIVLASTCEGDWVQSGADIDEEAADDWGGYSVSLSDDGSVVAIGAKNNGAYVGHVRVYEKTDGSWTQMGGDIDGEATYDESGRSVSLSSDGSVVAIGAIFNSGTASEAGHVRVYSYSGSWTQMGGDIDGEAAGDKSGLSVSLSTDGSIVAIGTKYNDGAGDSAGHVRVYSFSGGAWTQLGGDIDGEASVDQSGGSVSLSSDGSVVAIGAHLNDGTASAAGHVRVYSYSGGAWTQMGGDVDGEAYHDYSGHSVSLSDDGSIMAIGAYGNDDAGDSAGHVRVYSYSGGAWTQLGGDIDGEAAGDNSGYSVSLSSDGSVVAIGAYKNGYHDGTYLISNAGHVRVYSYSGGWTQVGKDIDGRGAWDQSGRSISLSADGSSVAIGAGENAGHVRVYSLKCHKVPALTCGADEVSSWTQLGADIDGEAAGDNSGYSVSLSDDGSIMAIGAYANAGTGVVSGHVRVYEKIDGGWIQLGGDIDGEAAYDYSGWSVSLSADGSVLAIGAIYNDATGYNAGHVRVYSFSDSGYNLKTDGTCKTYMTTAEECEAAAAALGLSDLTAVAQGWATDNPPGCFQDGSSSFLYFNTDASSPAHCTTSAKCICKGAWNQMGGDIDAEAQYDYSGYSVSLSTDGSVVAIGARHNDGIGPDAGHVRVYSYSGGAWTQLGGDIDGEAAGDRSGHTVSLSSDGSVVAIGAYANDGSANNAGHVRVYSYSGSWIQLGGDIDGEAAEDQSGYSVSLSADGSVVAIGAISNSDTGTTAGHVRVYSYSSGTWTQLGADIDGEAVNDNSGRSVSLSADGSVVAIGAYANDGTASNAGHVRMYSYSGGGWTQVGGDIDGEAAQDYSGQSVSLSADGSVVAIGASGNDGTGDTAGHVRVYSLECETCPVGKYEEESGCVQCPNGYFQDQTGQSSCSECPNGFATYGTSGLSCSTCPTGRFSSTPEQKTSYCVYCLAGKYADVEASSSCSNCLSGKYTDTPGQSACTTCPVGKYAQAGGSSSCMSCLSGKYTDTPGQSACTTCPAGYESTAISTSCTDTDDCPSSSCGNGVCVDGVASYTCTCDAGWEKDSAGNCNVNIDDCHATACKTPGGEFGVCTDLVNAFSCDCSLTDYNGPDCTVHIDDCAGVDCGWSSQCSDLNRAYACFCNDGTTATYCEEPDDPCDGVNCGDYGSCDGGVCTCTSGHSGTLCDIPPDPCDQDPCGDYGDCVAGIGSCNCDPGYSGVPCVDINECYPNPCKNGATCINLVNDYNCQCQPGWDGKDCDVDIDECEGASCGNGVCVDQVAGFICNCFPGWVTSTGYCDMDENNCGGASCGDGTCVDGNGTYTCDCDTGYTGAACDVNPDDCPTVNTCSGNGYCTDGLSDYTCTCNTGWFGKDCGSNIDYCSGVDCMNGDCEDKIASFECNCDTGWTTDSEGKCTVDIDECLESPCKNGGSCDDLVGDFDCTCATGWEGSTCEVNPDDCVGVDCGPGSCVDGFGMYTCSCDTGYEGDHCELNKDDCLLGSCNTHGTCNDGLNSFTCSCHDGWEGDNCESSVDDCPSTPCSGHGACVDEHKGYRCVCSIGFTGDVCEYTLDNCVGVSCGEGTCKNTMDGFECECTLGWTLKDGKCTENIDDCFVEGVGLVNCGDGTCKDGVNEYTCVCNPGFSGDHCETNIDECIPDPCVNGNCTDGINEFTCACEGGWYGERCDQNCLVDSDCDYKCSKGKCVTYSFFGDFKFYMLGIWCVIAFALLFLASLKSTNTRIKEFNKSDPEAVERQRYW